MCFVQTAAAKIGNFENYDNMINSIYVIVYQITIIIELIESLFSVTDASGNIVFCWNEKDKSNLLSAYFYGYIILQIFGGSLAEKFGTKIVLGLSGLVCSVLSLLLPIASKESLWISFAMRICQGLVAGVTFPSLPPMIMRYLSFKIANCTA